MTVPHALAHGFSLDLEEYFQVVALDPYVDRAKWESYPPRAAAATYRLLELMAVHGATGTFFTVGWLAERHPDLMRAIVAAGHEVASHTWDHLRITHQSSEHFRDSVRRTKQLLEDQTGTACIGFRAPSYSIVAGTEWALDVLVEEGYRYDSSLFPVKRSGYGYEGGGRDPYWIDRPTGRLAEFPPATLQVGTRVLPAAGGAYFRLLPESLVHTALTRYQRRGIPGIFYLHPWEYDPGQPRFEVPLLTRIRHYGGQAGVWRRLERLFTRFKFGRIDALLSPDSTAPTPLRRA